MEEKVIPRTYLYDDLVVLGKNYAVPLAVRIPSIDSYGNYILDKIADAVLRYRPKPKTKAAKRRKRREKRDAQAGANQAN